MRRPYVVSADIQLLLGEWANKRGFVLPGEEFFRQLREEFSLLMRRYFKEFIFVSEEELKNGIAHLIKAGGMVPLSLDRVYSDSLLHLDLTRVVHSRAWVGDGVLGPRADAPAFDQQCKMIERAELKEVVLVDDWIFTSASMQKVISALFCVGIRVPFVIAGLVTKEAVTRLNALGVEVRSLYAFEDLIDGVCERDFYPGVPLAGRLTVGEGHIRMPYILPFHPTGGWASIPWHDRFAFSERCLEYALWLFQAIERSSQKSVRYRDIGYGLVGLPFSLGGERYVNLLEGVLRGRLKAMESLNRNIM